MKRRIFLGGVFAPFVAFAQQPAPVIGFIDAGAQNLPTREQNSFVAGLATQGFEFGRTVATEYRWSQGDDDALPGFARELAARPVAAIVASGLYGALAARVASKTIPILYVGTVDLLEGGLVERTAKSRGNLAAIIPTLSDVMESERLQMLRALNPQAKTFGLLIRPGQGLESAQLVFLNNAAQRAGVRILALPAGTLADVEAAFGAFTRAGVGGLAVSDDPYPPELRRAIVAAAQRARLPAIYSARMFLDDGGLLSFGPDYPAAWREAGAYTGQLLKGAKPDDLPVLRPTKVDLAVNRAAAKAIDATLPDAILTRATETVN